jgi:ceramide glucosyltransferase
VVDRDYLRAVVGALQEPEVGIVTSVYRGVASPGFWPGVAVAMTNYHFLPGVITGLFIGRARPCFGQTIAITRATLERIGGLARFAHHLAEDHALGEAVRQIGARVVIPPFVVGHACVDDTFETLYAHELRWSCTIRAADRIGHAGSVLMHPLPLALLAMLLSGGTVVACGLTVAALAARALLMVKTARAIGASLRGAFWLPFVDLLQFLIFVSSFFSSHVIWRGTRFRVDREGLLSPAGKP